MEAFHCCLPEQAPEDLDTLAAFVSDRASDVARGPNKATPPATQQKVRELFTLAATHFLDVSALGIGPVDWANEASIAAAEALVMSSASTCSAGHLGQVSASLRRWIRAANENQFSLANPSPAQIATFLRQVSFGGPTAASRVYNALAWCNKHFGAAFPLDHS